ncbi:MAG: M48 family metalloprotease [Desulfurococcaceae archaeon]
MSGFAGLGFIDVAVDWFSWLLSIVVVDSVGVLASLFGVFLSFTVLDAVLYWLTRLRVAERASARLLSYWLTVLLQRPVRVRLVARAWELALVVLSSLLYFVVFYYSGLWNIPLIASILVVLVVLVYYGKLVLDEARPWREPRDDEAWVQEVVESVGRRYGCLGDAEVLIWESDNIGAYVELARPDMVTVTRGALERLTREELEAVLAHECGHLFYRVDALLSAPPLVAFFSPIVFLPLDVGLAVLGGVESSRLFLSSVLAVLALFAGFVLSVHHRMLVETLADLKSMEITGSDALASVLAKMEQFNKPVDIEGLLKKHLGLKFTLLYPIVRASITIIDAHPPLQLRIRVVREYYRRVAKT